MVYKLKNNHTFELIKDHYYVDNCCSIGPMCPVCNNYIPSDGAFCAGSTTKQKLLFYKNLRNKLTKAKEEINKKIQEYHSDAN